MALLDCLGVKSAHVVGASMGGMIAQSMALRYPQRVRSLVSIMSNTGSRFAGQPHVALYPVLLRPAPREREKFIDHVEKTFSVIGSPGFERDSEQLRDMARQSYERGHDREGDMRQLTSLDAQFLAMETPRTVGHVSGLAILDPSTAPGGRLGVEDICGLLSDRLHLLPPFRWRLATVPFDLDLPFWIEDPDFDLDFHVREIGLPAPGDRQQLAEQVARIVSRPLDRAHPLWELYVIHGLENGRVALLTKIHHAAVDGMSGAEIMGILFDTEREGRELPAPTGESTGERVPGQLELLGRGLLGLPRPLRALSVLPAALPRLDSIPVVGAMPGALPVSRVFTRIARLGRGTKDGGVLERTNVRAPRTRFNGRLTPHRRFAFASLPLDRVKAIKNAAGVTVNDTIVAICAGAMRAWLEERGELPPERLTRSSG